MENEAVPEYILSDYSVRTWADFDDDGVVVDSDIEEEYFE